jgi:hypothetical protein
VKLLFVAAVLSCVFQPACARGTMANATKPMNRKIDA